MIERLREFLREKWDDAWTWYPDPNYVPPFYKSEIFRQLMIKEANKHE